MELRGKLKKIYYDGVAVGYTKSDSIQRKTNTQSLIHKTNAGTGTTPLIEEVGAKSFSVTLSGDGYYVDAGDLKTLATAQFAADPDNSVAIKTVTSGGDTETYSKCLILDTSDDHPVDDFSTFKFSIQAFGTRTLGTTA